MLYILKDTVKNAPFFLSACYNSSRFTFNSQFLYGLKQMVHPSKSVWGIFHFRFRLVFIKTLYFCSTKSTNSLILKRHNSFQNKNNRKAAHNITHRPLIFKLQLFLKFNDICVSWSSPKSELKTNLENWSFE